MRTTQSISRARLTAVRKLLQKKYRDESKTFLVEGRRNVEEAVASGWHVDMILMTPAFQSAGDHGMLLRRIEEKHLAINRISEDSLKKVSDTEHSQGIVAVVRQPAPAMETPSAGIIVALDGISEPGNAGTIIRTCDWFGVARVLVGKNSVEVFNPKVVRSAMGSIFHVPVTSGVDLAATLQDLKARGFAVWTTVVEGGTEIGRVRRGERLAVVLGNETRGVSDDVARLSDARIHIPGFGRAESLNVATACAVILGILRLGGRASS